jgi:hypothetical protein
VTERRFRSKVVGLVTERTKAILVVFGFAAFAGVMIELQRNRGKSPEAQSSASSASAASPAITTRGATKAEVDQAIATLERGVKTGAGDPKNPWALAHGLLAFGMGFAATDGQSAVDVIGTFAEKQKLDEETVWLFPEKKEGQMVEPHRFLLVKTLLEIGVPLGRSLPTSTPEKVTLARLVGDMHRAATLPKTEADYRQLPWLLSALTFHAKRDNADAAVSVGPSVKELTSLALTHLENDHKVLLEHSGSPETAFDEGSPLAKAKRDKAGIYGQPCGGLHEIQSVLLGAALDRDPAIVSRVQKQLGVLLYRWELERAGYAALLAKHPDQGLLLRVQELKFFGHVLETLALAKSLDLADKQSEGSRRIEGAIRAVAADVTDVVRALSEGGVYDRLPAIRAEREQTYLDLIGDGCHAIHGLRLARALYD